MAPCPWRWLKIVNMPSMGSALVNNTAPRKAGSSMGTHHCNTAHMIKGLKNNLPNTMGITVLRRPSALSPTNEPPMTNKDKAALACANKSTVRPTGAGMDQPERENKKPAVMPQIIGFCVRFFRVCSSTLGH